MTPGKLDLPTIWRGCDWGPVFLRWKDQNGQPIDLTPLRARAYSLNINLGAVVRDQVNFRGETFLYLDRDQTAEVKLGTEKWDWIFEAADGTSYRFPPFLSGTVIIRDPVTTIEPERPPDSNGEFPIDPPEIILPFMQYR